jgi:predicted dehydrogenase
MKVLSNRRDFIKLSALGAAMLGITGFGCSGSKETILEKIKKMSSPQFRRGNSVIGLKAPPIKQVKVAFIGLGNRGIQHLQVVDSLCPDKAVIKAICDVQQIKIDAALEELKKSGRNQKPAVYSGTLEIWKEMIKRDDIDLVIISTPWEDHAPMSLLSMQNNKHVAVEVPAAYTLPDTWELVDTAEETQRHFMMLENVCYGEEELWLLNMALQGVLGTLTYAECAYIHNLRELLFSKDYYYNMWRIRHNMNRDGNLYPTHGIGPVSQYMNVNRGDSFRNLVSMSSLQASLDEYSANVENTNEFFGKSGYKHGDMNNTLIKTAKGRMIMVQHDVVTPRPYSRINALAGTKGYHEGYPGRLALVEKGHKWLEEKDYKEIREKYKHPLWEKLKSGIEKYGSHGGMDFVMIYRLIDSLNNGWFLDEDVYDAASWSSVIPLSTLSVELGNMPLEFPDYTRGRWMENRELGIVTNY